MTKRDSYLRRTYGITEAQYKDILLSQGGKCAICPKSPADGENFAVDHDHVSMEIRGILCRYCNHRLVGRHRNPELLRKIADYVSQGTGFIVPKKKKKKRRKPSLLGGRKKRKRR